MRSPGAILLLGSAAAQPGGGAGLPAATPAPAPGPYSWPNQPFDISIAAGPWETCLNWSASHCPLTCSACQVTGPTVTYESSGDSVQSLRIGLGGGLRLKIPLARPGDAGHVHSPKTRPSSSTTAAKAL
jgi:hypothetical protein